VFIALIAGQTDLSGDASVDVQTLMNPGLSGGREVIGPGHGTDGVNEAAVNGRQVTRGQWTWGKVPAA